MLLRSSRAPLNFNTRTVMYNLSSADESLENTMLVTRPAWHFFLSFLRATEKGEDIQRKAVHTLVHTLIFSTVSTQGS